MFTTDPAAQLPAGLTVPGAYRHRHVRHERHGDVPVTVTRYQRVPGLTYGGEHVTTVIGTESGLLYGYTRQLASVDADALPSIRTARQVAFDLLRAVDAGYAGGLTERWIDRHDEEIVVEGKPQTVAGIKVKTSHANGLYAWVIVGEKGQVVTYERDVAWDTSRGRRDTSMWLHDRWIVARDTGGAALDAPAAPLTV